MLLASAQGCSSHNPSLLQSPNASCSQSVEEFLASTSQSYELFKRDNRSTLRDSREFIRDTRAKVERLATTGPSPLTWEEGDSFPSVTRRDGSLFRLTPIMRHHKLEEISRVAISRNATGVAVITRRSNSPAHSILIIDLESASTQVLDIDAYDALWIDETTLLISERVDQEPRVIRSLRLGAPPQEIAQAKRRGENLLLHAVDQDGYAIIEHAHPSWSFFEVLSATTPTRAKAITPKDAPGSTCVIMESALLCSSFRIHKMGSIIRMDLEKRSAPHTVYIESSGGSIGNLAATPEGLAVFTSHGSHSTVSLVKSDGATIKGPIAYGPTTTLSPAPPLLRARGTTVTKRSFLRPTTHASIDELLNASNFGGASLCDNCAERSMFATSADGTAIPISVALPPNPVGLLVHVYGSYGVSAVAEFQPQTLSLLQRNIAVAIVHVRGGGDLGPSWHLRAIGARKARSIEDLSASVSELTRALALHPHQIVARGRSAGAWLVAKTANAHPGLFGGMILEAPLLDLERAVLDRDLPLHQREEYEWGDSLETLRALYPDPSTSGLTLNLLAMVPLRDELVPPTLTRQWLQEFKCHQNPNFETIVSLIPRASHSGPTSRGENDEWDAVQTTFITHVIEKKHLPVGHNLGASSSRP